MFKLFPEGVAVPESSVNVVATEPAEDIVTDPPKFTGEPLTEMPVPAVTVMGLEATAPPVTVNSVPLKDATPFCVDVAFKAVIVIVDPLPDVLIPCKAVPKTFRFPPEAAAVPVSSVKVIELGAVEAIIILPGPLVMVIPDPAVRFA